LNKEQAEAEIQPLPDGEDDEFK